MTRTVIDLVVGSGEDQGEHELKGVPGNWRLFGVKNLGNGTNTAP